MKKPFIYPEPNLYKTTYGYFDADKHWNASVSEEAVLEVPDIVEVLKRILGIEEISLGAIGAVALRKLEEDDIAQINHQFFTNYKFAELGVESYVILVRLEGVEVAAAGSSGFYYALKKLKQLMSERKTIKNAIVFYHPFKELRQVCMNLPNHGQYEFFLKMLDEIADLQYNSIVFKNCDSSHLPREKIESIADLCRSNSIAAHFCKDNLSDAPEAAFELDASSVASWELRTRFTKYIEAIGDAKVSYSGEISEEAMIQDGFIFRLVMGSYALNHFNFANSTWEKVLPLAMERTFLFMSHVNGVTIPSGSESADRYPVLVGNQDGDIVMRKPFPVVHFNEQMTISEIQESSDSVVFRHTVEAENDLPASGETIGYYLVHYSSGEQKRIDLIMDQNISCETVKWNHEFNPITHTYDTDSRLHRVSYHTRPVLYAKANSNIVTLYDFEWINPVPNSTVNQITAVVTNAHCCLCVYRLDNVVITR